MSLNLSIDRFEGDEKEIAVLVGDDNLTINVPKSILPKGSKPGEILTLSFKLDIAATKELAVETKRLQDEMTASDPGGDIKL